MRRLLTTAVLLFVLIVPAFAQQGKVAPKPLFRDPIHDGAADPTLIWNRALKQWWMFYTNRRADQATDDPKDVSWFHGTRIGIATSVDNGATWKYKGIANIPYGNAETTHWAPEIIDDGKLYHMYLSIVPGIFKDWNAPRDIIQLTSPDLVHWTFVSKLDLASERVIDPTVFPVGDGTWRLWYKDERDESLIHSADSSDLSHWKPMGRALTDRHSEGPKVFRFHGTDWMIVDSWDGLGVYSSTDLADWKRQSENILATPGAMPTDRGIGHHCDVIVSGDRAFIFYFTHQNGPDLDPRLSHSEGRTVLQVAELHIKDGKLTADRDTPTRVFLKPGSSFGAE